jgi:hypothetical protein
MVAPKKRAVRKRQPKETSEGFLFEIEKVHSHYSFGNGFKFDRAAFAEFLHPEFDTKCLAPPKFAGRPTRFTLIGDRENERDLWLQTPADAWERGVGTLTFRGERSEYLGGVPFDALWNVVAAFLAGNLHFIHLHVAAMKNGTSRIRSIAFYEEFDLDNA